MQRAYIGVRLVSYACGLLAVLLILVGNEGGRSAWMVQAGYLLLLAMFVLFGASYVLYALIQRRR